MATERNRANDNIVNRINAMDARLRREEYSQPAETETGQPVESTLPRGSVRTEHLASIDQIVSEGDLDLVSGADGVVRVVGDLVVGGSFIGPTGAQTFAQPDEPTGLGLDDEGALWADTDDQNHLYRWSGTAWVSMRDQLIIENGTAVDDLEQAVDSIAGPTGRLTEAEATLNNINGPGGTLEQMQTAVTQAQNTADGSIRTYYEDTAPWADGTPQPESAVGDLWLEIPTGIAYRWSGTAWVIVPDAGIAEALQTARQARDEAEDAMAAAVLARNRLTTYYTATAPVAPAEGFVTGDLWINTSTTPSTLRRWSGSAWLDITDDVLAKALEAADGAQATADQKVRTFSQPDAPTGMLAEDIGDLWIDTDDKNHLKRWTGTQWISLRDGTVGDALALAGAKSTTYYTATAPASPATGDFWIDTSTASRALKRWSGSAWIDVTNDVLRSALDDAADAQATADQKVRTFAQTTAPTGMLAEDVGDLWVDTDDKNKLYRWSGTAWDPIRDTDIAAALSAATNANNALAGKITTFYTSSTPTATAVGDLWINTGIVPNQLRRWSGSAWVDVSDAVLAKALVAASTAQGTADQKIRTFAQTTPPTGMTEGDAGDIWLDTDDGNKMHRWSGTAWVAVQDTAIGSAQLAADAAWNRAENLMRTGNLIPNGALERRTVATGFGTNGATSLELSTDVPPGAGVEYSFQRIGAGGTVAVQGENFPVTPGASYFYEFWLKADKPNSVIYMELRRPSDNAHAGTSAATGIPGDNYTGGSVYLAANLSVPTEWTRYRGVYTMDSATTEARLSSIYFNHSAGTERTAYQRIAGLRMIPIGPYNDALTAQQTANTALTNASNAQLSANGKNQVVYSASPASGTSRNNVAFINGDVWFQISGNQVIGQWQHNGSSWIQTTVSHLVIASVDLGKATIGQLDGMYIKALSISVDKLLVGLGTNLLSNPQFKNSGEGWSTGGLISYSTDQGYSGGASVLMAASTLQRGTYLGAQIGADTIKYAARVEPGQSYRLRAWARTASPAPANSIAVYARLYDETGSSLGFTTPSNVSNSTATSTNVYYLVEGVVTIPTTSTAKYMAIGLFVQTTYTSAVRFSDPSITLAMDNSLVVDGGILSRHITATEDIVGKRFRGSKMTLEPTTLVDAGGVTSPGAGGEFVILDATGNERVRLDAGDDGTFATFGSADGQATIGSDGTVAGTAGSFQTASLGGDDLRDMIDALPKGVIARSAFGQFRANFSTTSEAGITELRFRTPPGPDREYRIVGANLGVAAASTAGQRFRLRWTTDGTRPSTASQDYVIWEVPVNTTDTGFNFSREYSFPANTDVRILLTISPRSGTGYWDLRQGTELSVIDEGRKIERTGVAVVGTTAAADPIENYVKEYTSSWSRSFMGNNAPRSVENGKMHQGYTAYWPAGGNQRSMFGGFGTMSSDLNGATITSMEFYVYFEHWHNGSGGIASFGLHNVSAMPSTSSGLGAAQFTSANWPRGSGRWVAVPSSLWNGFKNGVSYKGFGLITTSTSTSYYGYASGTAKIRVKYTK